ncbi:MAG: C39 family peptidase [archaeon]|jgi:ABC-type bacteriocin/lantibiotic exporter with double-glycine peptidase domain
MKLRRTTALHPKQKSIQSIQRKGLLAKTQKPTQKILLPVGHFLQTIPFACGPSALKIILDHLGNSQKIETLIKETKCSPKWPYKGTLHSGFRLALQKLGHEFIEKQNAELKDIESALKKGQPVLVDFMDHHFYYGGHFAVIVGQDTKRFRISNPSLKAKYEWLPKQEFYKEWVCEDTPGRRINRWMLVVLKKQTK